ncbi:MULTISPECIES: peptidase T [Segatella]|jgi:tripeptide aminopeptidase|uniref:Peptidase T n=2 Tax=Segatella TaxID=2974251 RepID=D8DUS1_9BACT|nr:MULTISPECIES: peptidase T [Segatella]MBQ3857169.1 peptidase T [Prevotella sp.]EFI72761.1 peptidase T [Segatella baroniae B14]MDR4929770.1 peptidase T [Segatella bryantii]MEE3415009.1 peptidase T [Prevotella sp.]OYP56341.1 peptidase T [Segatella bryantii]
MEITERFINYTKFDTQSSEDSDCVPSTAKQLEFAKYLKKELEDEKFSDVEMDEMGYIYATLKANTKKNIPTIGFISHYDTSPDCSGKDIKARIVKNYDGNDIELSPGIISSTAKFPELKEHIGEDLIVTDGTTLLGADDKAGIAEIMQAMCYLRDHDEIKHGDIRVGFNPDEEIGMGAHHFDVEKFGCEWAYTMDGGDLGDLEYENFNAASAKIHIKGVSVHPGYAKDKMINANRLAVEFQNMIPADQTPECTEGYEGFYHLLHLEGSIEEAQLSYIIRDHDRDKFEDRKKYIANCAEKLNEKYGQGTCTVELHDQYYNMKEKIEPNMHVIDIVLKAMQETGVPPRVAPIRGGTDGAQLSFKGLPCPNIFAGGVNYHGPYEFVSVQVMEKAVQTIVKICEITAAFND